MSNIFFTSDLHFGHEGILKHSSSSRPFSSVEKMDNKLIDNWNSEVSKNDTIYVIGDFCFKNKEYSEKILNRLKGKIHLILGNHDTKVPTHKFESLSTIKEIKIPDLDARHGQQYIVLCHYAMRVWNKSHYGTWHLYGHSHGTLKDNPNSLSIDVGVDTNNLFPYSYEEIKEKMKCKRFIPIDHHGL